MLKGKTVILGVTGGIAAYKAAMLCSALVKQHCSVKVVMTRNAAEFITPLTFETLSGSRVALDTFDRNRPHQTEHISLSDEADLVLIAPATANVIAKLAHGIADDMLTTTVLSCDCPKLIAPAMNTRMYENPVTQDNLSLLRKYGWEIIEPGTGRLACGSEGKGRMAEPEELLEAVIHSVSHEKDMKGLKVLVTAGPTLEAIDPVRFISNHSTGKMGYALARRAAARGAEVTLVTGPSSLKAPSFTEVVRITSASDMFREVTSRAPEMDIVIKAAAVADYRPRRASEEKIKKTGSEASIALERTEDILSFLGEHKREGQLLCGFSMETEDLLPNSRRKLEGKNLDMVCANSLREEGAGFAVDTNILTLISKDKETSLPLMSKEEAADRILDELLRLR